MSTWVSTMERKRSSLSSSRRRSASSSSARATFSRASASLAGPGGDLLGHLGAEGDDPFHAPVGRGDRKVGDAEPSPSQPSLRLEEQGMLRVVVRLPGAEHLLHRPDERVVAPVGQHLGHRPPQELPLPVVLAVAGIDELVGQLRPTQVGHLGRDVLQQRLQGQTPLLGPAALSLAVAQRQLGLLLRGDVAEVDQQRLPGAAGVDPEPAADAPVVVVDEGVGGLAGLHRPHVAGEHSRTLGVGGGGPEALPELLPRRPSMTFAAAGFT